MNANIKIEDIEKSFNQIEGRKFLLFNFGDLSRDRYITIYDASNKAKFIEMINEELELIFESKPFKVEPYEQHIAIYDDNISLCLADWTDGVISC